MQLRDLFDESVPTGGAVVPLALQQLMREELNIKEDWNKTEQLLLKAREAMPERLEILIALYKLYAYSNRFDESLQIIDEVLATAATQEGFDADWRKLDINSAQWYPAMGAVRQYLYSLKTIGFVSLRKGDVTTAFAVLTKLQELDSRDRVGGSVVLEMAESLLEETCDEEL